RAGVPIAVYVVDAIPLTAVGKIFKPALRREATRRAVVRLLGDVVSTEVEIEVDVHPHASLGHRIDITVGPVPANLREGLARKIDERLGPLEIQHEIAWR